MKIRITLLLTITYFFLVSSTIDITNLFNYEAQSRPNYINRDNTDGNAITDEGATLGRVLFYDKKLSLNNTVSCASCHQQQFAFSDPAVQSVGQDGRLTGRHSMRLINARFSNEDRFFWDKRAPTLEAQTTQPIQDHIEMGFSGINGQPALDSLIRKMDDIAYYSSLFELAFGDNTITETRMQQALAQFVRSIQSFDSKYDIGRAATGNDNANFPNFTDSENRGKTLFMTPPPNRNNPNGGAGCDACHQAPGFDLRNNSGNNGVVGVAGIPGGQDVTNTRSPTLRDLVNPSGQLNGPMMHDGSFTTIAQVIDHYDDVPNVPGRDNRLRANLNLTATEKQDLENFLLTLSGSDVYTNEKWSDPFDMDGNLTVLDGSCEVDMTMDASISNGTHTYGASNSISANNDISNATVTYQAGSTITLTNGFHARPGATFTARISATSCTDLQENTAPATARTTTQSEELISEEPVFSNNEQVTTFDDAFEKQTLTLYPNPFNHELTIDLGHYSENTIEIYLYNSVGQEVKRLNIQEQTRINLSHLESGIYFLRAIEEGKLITTKKVIKG